MSMYNDPMHPMYVEYNKDAMTMSYGGGPPGHIKDKLCEHLPFLPFCGDDTPPPSTTVSEPATMVMMLGGIACLAVTKAYRSIRE